MEKTKIQEWFRSFHERGLEGEKYLDRGLWRWERRSSLWFKEVEWRRNSPWSEEVETAQQETKRQQTKEIGESERESKRDEERGKIQKNGVERK